MKCCCEFQVAELSSAFEGRHKPMNVLTFYSVVNNLTAHDDTRDMIKLSKRRLFLPKASIWLKCQKCKNIANSY